MIIEISNVFFVDCSHLGTNIDWRDVEKELLKLPMEHGKLYAVEIETKYISGRQGHVRSKRVRYIVKRIFAGRDGWSYDHAEKSSWASFIPFPKINQDIKNDGNANDESS